MAVRLYINHFSSKLTAQLLAAGTTANITAGDGALLAGANGTDWFIGTLRRISGYKDVAREIVKITLRSTDALTIVRAQESTTALQFEIGDQLDIDFTATSITSGVAGSVDITNVTGTGNLDLANTTSSTTGVISKATARFIHNFAAAGSDGVNTFIGVNAGNFSMGPAGGASYLGSSNTVTGANSFQSNSTGYNNTAFGLATLLYNTTGYYNSANGNSALLFNTTGYTNTGMGSFALIDNTTGYQNTALGASSGSVLTTGSNNTYLGYGISALTTSEANALVIGASAVSLGSNNTVIGNSSTTAAKIWGNLTATGTVADVLGDVRLIPQNSKSAAYTTVLADAGKHILHPSADTTARTFTIDSNANVAYPVGTAITFVNQNAGGVVTIAITTDTMRLAGAGTTGSRTLAANGTATALKITTTEWIVSGTGLT